jgi:hypothetical protein
MNYKPVLLSEEYGDKTGISDCIMFVHNVGL